MHCFCPALPLNRITLVQWFYNILRAFTITWSALILLLGLWIVPAVTLMNGDELDCAVLPCQFFSCVVRLTDPYQLFSLILQPSGLVPR